MTKEERNSFENEIVRRYYHAKELIDHLREYLQKGEHITLTVEESLEEFKNKKQKEVENEVYQ